MSLLYQKNTTATVLQWIGWIILILTLLLAIPFYPLIPIGLISGMLLIGLAEAIKLLQGIYNRMDPEFDGNPFASDPQKKAVVSIYQKLGKPILSIEDTKTRFHYLVETDEGKEIVNVGLFEPRFMTIEAALEQGIVDFITIEDAVGKGILKSDDNEAARE